MSHSALRLFSLLCKFIFCPQFAVIYIKYSHSTIIMGYHENCIPAVFLASLRFHLLPSAFLASHLLGLERCVVELRGAVLRSPMAMLRALRKTDGQVGKIFIQI